MIDSTATIHDTAMVSGEASIGPNTQVWQNCIVLNGASIGRNCKLAHNVFVEGKATIQNGVTVKDNVVLYDGVHVEDDVFIGPNAVFTNVLTPRAFIPRPEEFKTTVIRTGATIGANATVLCGIEIGEYAMIAAGSVVTKAVPPFGLVRGNPARRVGWVSRAGRVLGDDLTCPESGVCYRQQDDRLVPLD